MLEYANQKTTLEEHPVGFNKSSGKWTTVAGEHDSWMEALAEAKRLLQTQNSQHDGSEQSSP